jgi:hypothetical protein
MGTFTLTTVACGTMDIVLSQACRKRRAGGYVVGQAGDPRAAPEADRTQYEQFRSAGCSRFYATRRRGPPAGLLPGGVSRSVFSPFRTCVTSAAAAIMSPWRISPSGSPAASVCLVSSSRVRIRHSRRSRSLRTRAPGAVALNQSQATPASSQSSLARFRIAASSTFATPMPPAYVRHVGSKRTAL